MKKLMYLLGAVVAFCLLGGCSESSEDDGPVAVVLDDVQFYINVTNDEGEDLLHPETENTFNTDRIEYYEKVEGEYQRIYLGDSYQFPKRYMIHEYEGDLPGYEVGEYLFFSLVEHTGQDRYELKIDWGNGYDHEIEITCEEAHGRMFADKIYLGGELVWSAATHDYEVFDGAYFEIMITE